MIFYLFLLLIVLPLAEILILIKIGLATSVWIPIAIVLATGIIGSALARWQGFKVLDRVRDDLSAGRVPADSLIDALLVLVAGGLFILPGVLTDIAGIVLLVPQTRALVKRAVTAWIKNYVDVRVGRAHSAFWTDSGGQPTFGRDQIIDAKVLDKRVEDVKNV
jgi:UPF0716 protein FxsA